MQGENWQNIISKQNKQISFHHLDSQKISTYVPKFLREIDFKNKFKNI